MNGYLITLIIIAVIGFIYAFGFLVNISFLFVFLRKLEQHQKALVIVLCQKYDAEAAILDLYAKNDIEVSKELYDVFEGIDIHHFEVLDSLMCLKDRTSLSYLRQELLAVVKGNETFLKNEQFQKQVSIISHCDEQFRFLAASYNADVLGYNYWIEFQPYRYFFKLNQVQKRNILS